MATRAAPTNGSRSLTLTVAACQTSKILNTCTSCWGCGKGERSGNRSSYSSNNLHCVPVPPGEPCKTLSPNERERGWGRQTIDTRQPMIRGLRYLGIPNFSMAITLAVWRKMKITLPQRQLSSAAAAAASYLSLYNTRASHWTC